MHNLDYVRCRNADINFFSSVEYNGKLTLLALNVRSLRGKFPEVIAYINLLKLNLTFIILTEVNLSDELDYGYDIPSFNKKSLLRPHHRGYIGGGIFIYYRDYIDAYIIENLSGLFCSHESLTLKCRIPKYGDILVCGIYRPPHLSKAAFVNYFDNNLPRFSEYRCIFGGDFNIDVNETQPLPIVQSFIDVFTALNFCKCIDKPTRFCERRAILNSSLDNFWHNTKDCTSSFIISPPISDHMGIVLILDKVVENSKKVTISFRDFSINNKNLFMENLDHECSMFNFNLDFDVNYNTAKFVNWSNLLVDQYFPVKTKNISKKRIYAPWINRQIVKLILKKHKWFNLLKAKIITYNCYKCFANDLRRLLKIAESLYYKNKLKSMSNNSKNNWKILNSMLGRKKEESSSSFVVNDENISNAKVIANEFNNYFASIPDEIRSQIPETNLNGLNHIARNENSMVLYQCTIEEVKNIIGSMKGSKVENDLNLKMLKIGVDYFSSFITVLINMCVETGTYPDLLKIAHITPIYKSGAKNNVCNYRPISILINLNKIFEKYLQKRLTSFFGHFNLFSNKQHGFKSGYNTETALLHFISSVLPAFENKTYSLAVLLDFKKAFNCMDQNLLLKKLDLYGVRGLVQNLIKSYLENRPQKVRYKNEASGIKYVNVGIPQGSCIGPIMYNIYTNDLDDFIRDIFKVFYADDTAITMCHSDLHILQETLADVLVRVEQWCSFNRLALSTNKTKAILFTNCIVEPPQLCIYNVPIEFVDNYKYLGICVDSKLKFNVHLKELKIKLSRNSGIAYRLQSKLDLCSAKSLYYSFTYSAISYCICIYGGLLLCTERGNKIKKLHKRIILNLFGPHYQNLSFCEILQ
jgi:hypothetical protein